MPNIKKALILGSAVFAAEFILIQLVYPMLGSNINGYLTGLSLGTGISSILIMAVATLALIYAGMFLYEQKTVKLWQGKNLTQRIFAMLLYSQVILFILLSVMSMSISMNTLIGVGINLAALSAIVLMSSKYLGFPRV